MALNNKVGIKSVGDGDGDIVGSGVVFEIGDKVGAEMGANVSAGVGAIVFL